MNARFSVFWEIPAFRAVPPNCCSQDPNPAPVLPQTRRIKKTLKHCWNIYCAMIRKGRLPAAIMNIRWWSASRRRGRLPILETLLKMICRFLPWVKIRQRRLKSLTGSAGPRAEAGLQVRGGDSVAL